MQFTQAEIDRMMTNYDNFHELQREQIIDLTTAIHNLTIERNEKIDRLTIVSKERDRLREVLAAIVNSPKPDPDLTSLARELVAPKPKKANWESWRETNEVAKEACGIRP